MLLNAAGLVLALALAVLMIGGATAQNGPVITNGQVIDSQEAGPDLSDPVDVFAYVLRGLPSDVTIYPSENYLYFRFPAGGYEIWGSMTLSAATRDEGIVGFGYTAKPEGGRGRALIAPPGGGHTFAAADGIVVTRLGDFDYRVTFRGITREFRLFDVGMSPPGSFELLETERAVSPLMDESGLSFHLIFNQTEKRLYLALNEDVDVVERFRRVTDRLIVGERTGFAFFDDPETGRKLLIGVEGAHVLANDWYDGPFDQMPDNNVKLGRIPDYRALLVANYPALEGRIDQYGRHLARPGSRVAVAPYLVYFSEDQLIARVSACEDEAPATDTQSRGRLFACLSIQEFNLPPRADAPGSAER